MKRFALVPLALAAILSGCSEKATDVLNPTKYKDAADSLVQNSTSLMKFVTLPTPSCTASVAKPETLTVAFAAKPAIGNAGFICSVWNDTVEAAADEMTVTVLPFADTTRGTAKIVVTPGVNAERVDYTMVISATSGLLKDSAEVTVFADVVEEPIVLDTAILYNVFGKGASALNAATNTTLSGTINMTTADAIYAKADSAYIDIKTVNSVGRATTLLDSLVSVNGTVFAAIDSATFEEADSAKIVTALKGATAKGINVGKTPYFVAKLANNRGAIIAGAVVEKDFSSATTSTTNVGRASIFYVYLSPEDLQ